MVGRSTSCTTNYLNPTITDEATPLLQVTAKDKPVVVGWAYKRPGGGRSFGTTLGHYYRNFQREPFRRMIVNAILWTAKVEVPKGGCPSQTPTDAEMKANLDKKGGR